MTVPEKLKKLREQMRRKGVDAWIVPTDDFHGSENVAGYFQERAWLTGFTGSAGTALVTADHAYLWTDGRYFLQAEIELRGSGIDLMKSGEEGVPSLEDFVKQNLKKGMVLGCDGRCVTAGREDLLVKQLREQGVVCKSESEDGPWDLVGDIWDDRPLPECHRVWELDPAIAGESRAEKISRLRRAMEQEKCEYHILTTLDDIAWLLNLRGSDVEYNPVFYANLLVTLDHILLFSRKEEFDSEILASLLEDQVELREYGDIYRVLREMTSGSRVLVDSSRVNYTVWNALEHTRRVDRANPTTLMKAVKNPSEMQHMREAHLKDGIAVTKFIFWLKQQMKNYDPGHPLTEITAAEKLLSFRQEQEHFLDLSFETISGYGPHGAIIHYSASKESDAALKPESFLLVDSGGHYLEGSTDITRTISCGNLTQEEKECYTRVLRGNLNLGNARFRYGCSGAALDYLAREPLWEIGLDYRHGTGHGVGFLLNIHEGPNNIGYRISKNRPLPCVLEEGMVTSNEPGVYVEGKFGVRCENLTLCVKDKKTEYGQFMRFETLTLVPWELDAVIPELLSEREKAVLNEYHRTVYEKISPYLDEEESSWLREATRPV